MMQNWAIGHGHVDRTLRGRRVLDTAEGVLVGLRACTPDAAFRELLSVAERHAVPVFAVAAALVDLACRQTSPPGPDPQGHIASAAWEAARREWSGLVGRTH